MATLFGKKIIRRYLSFNILKGGDFEQDYNYNGELTLFYQGFLLARPESLGILVFNNFHGKMEGRFVIRRWRSLRLGRPFHSRSRIPRRPNSHHDLF